MVMLPTQDIEKNVCRYDVLVNPKFDSSEIPDTPSTITRKGLKVWDDAKDKDSRPTEVAVQLLRDGKVYDTKTLSTKNNWRYTWSGLDDRYTWSVVEKNYKGYTVRIEREGITFVITNTRSNGTPDTPSPTDPKLPQTGQLWWPVPLLLMGGLLFLIIGVVCRKRKGHET